MLSPPINCSEAKTMSTDAQILHAEYIAARDAILKQTRSATMTDYLDAIRPLWFAYRDSLESLRLESQRTFKQAA